MHISCFHNIYLSNVPSYSHLTLGASRLAGKTLLKSLTGLQKLWVGANRWMKQKVGGKGAALKYQLKAISLFVVGSTCLHKRRLTRRRRHAGRNHPPSPDLSEVVPQAVPCCTRPTSDALASRLQLPAHCRTG